MSAPRRIPIVDLKAQLKRIRPEIDEAIARVLASTAFVFGEDVKELEHEFADFCGTTHACAVANGTDALHIALRAHGIGPKIATNGTYLTPELIDSWVGSGVRSVQFSLDTLRSDRHAYLNGGGTHDLEAILHFNHEQSL